MSSGVMAKTGQATITMSQFKFTPGNDCSQSIDHLLIRYVSETTGDLILEYCNTSRPRISGYLEELEYSVTSLAQCANISAVTLISALIYIRRLVSHHQPTDICPETSYIIFLAALIIATKFLYDQAPIKFIKMLKRIRLDTNDIIEAELQLATDLHWVLALTERDLNEEFERFENITGVKIDNVKRAEWRIEDTNTGLSWITNVAQTLLRKWRTVMRPDELSAIKP